MSMHHACTVYHGVHVARPTRSWLHTALHTAQVFTLLFGLFLLLFWSTMFIAYPRAGGTQLELVPCNSRAHYSILTMPLFTMTRLRLTTIGA